MYRKSFPKCEVAGEKVPAKFSHMASQGAIPKKCSTCSNLFEGECTRGLDSVGSLLRLDYNSCAKPGSSNPIEIEVINGDSVTVPKKCLNCEFLNKSNDRGYCCNAEIEIWKDFPRDLDWGNWEPDYPLIGLRRFRKGKHSNEDLGPAIISKELVLLLMKKENTKAIKLYKTLNNIETIKEANEDIMALIERLKNATF